MKKTVRKEDFLFEVCCNKNDLLRRKKNRFFFKDEMDEMGVILRPTDPFNCEFRYDVKMVTLKLVPPTQKERKIKDTRLNLFKSSRFNKKKLQKQTQC